jgi:hypothetical protein
VFDIVVVFVVVILKKSSFIVVDWIKICVWLKLLLYKKQLKDVWLKLLMKMLLIIKWLKKYSFVVLNYVIVHWIINKLLIQQCNIKINYIFIVSLITFLLKILLKYSKLFIKSSFWHVARALSMVLSFLFCRQRQIERKVKAKVILVSLYFQRFFLCFKKNKLAKIN